MENIAEAITVPWVVAMMDERDMVVEASAHAAGGFAKSTEVGLDENCRFRMAGIAVESV